MPARSLPLTPPGDGKGSIQLPPAGMYRVSQETGSDTYINHVPEGGTEELQSCSRLSAVLRRASLHVRRHRADSSRSHRRLHPCLSAVFLSPPPTPSSFAAPSPIRSAPSSSAPACSSSRAKRRRRRHHRRRRLLRDPQHPARPLRPAHLCAPPSLPASAQDFYGGRTDVVTRNVVLEVASVTRRSTVTATGIPTPIQQISSAVTLIPQSDLVTRVGIVDDLRQSPGVAVVQTGQAGGVTSLFVRGGNSTANKVLIDGIPANDVGGTFDFGTVSSTGLTGLELYRGPNSALYGTDAGASVVNLDTPRGSSLSPVLNYSGDAGNFHTYRNEAALSGAWNRLDYYGAFSRFDTSNALPRDEYHSATSVANLGYNITANTQARFTIRNADSATGLPRHTTSTASPPTASRPTRTSTPASPSKTVWKGTGTTSSATTSPASASRNSSSPTSALPSPSTSEPYLARSGGGLLHRVLRQHRHHPRSQRLHRHRPGLLLHPHRRTPSPIATSSTTSPTTPSPTASPRSSASATRTSAAASSPAYDNEKIQRTNYEYTLQFQGDIKNRFFYSVGGGIEKNHLYGITGTPRIGLAYVPVRPSQAAASTAPKSAPTQPPAYRSLPSPSSSPASTPSSSPTATPPTSSSTTSRPPALSAPAPTTSASTRTSSAEKLIFKAGYFHNVFDHQLEGVDAGALEQVFGYPPSVAQSVFTPYLNSLAFRAQGFETEIQYQPLKHLFLHGGYTYLDAIVIHSFSSDAYQRRSIQHQP